MKKLTIIHTTSATLNSIPVLIEEKYPDFNVVNIVDDSLLNDIKKEGDITSEVIERFIQYSIIAKNNKSDAILVACSSIGYAVDVARKFMNIPIYKIDEPMAEEAITLGEKILVVGTVKSTLDPTIKLIKSKVKSNNYQIDGKLVHGAFELLLVDKEAHDQKIAEIVMAFEGKYDVIVLAQASMSSAKKYINSQKPLLTSLPNGINQLEKVFEE